MASKNFAGAQVLSQVYGQALAGGGAHVTFTDAVGPTEVAFPALQAGTYDAYADYQGTLLTYLGGTPTANSAKTHAALVAKLQGTGITVSAAAPAVDVNGFFVTREDREEVRLAHGVRPGEGRASRSRSARRPSARPDRCASVTRHSARTA